MQRYGSTNDGGYAMCANLLSAVTVGYSYGIEGRDEWGCQLSTEIEVPVRQYDCFDLQRPACSTGRTVFYGECVGDARRVQEGRVVDSLASQFAANGDSDGRLVVKMDVEGAEWAALGSTPDFVLAKIDQLVVEFHGVGRWEYLAVFRKLQRTFYVADVHFNNFSCSPGITPFPSHVYEVLFVNKRLATVGTSTRTGPMTRAVHAPNDPMAPDCQATWR